MKLSRLFKGLKNQPRDTKKEQAAKPAEAPRKETVPAQERETEARPRKPASPASSATPASASPQQGKPDFNDVANIFGTIQSVLEDDHSETASADQKYIEIPCAAVLSRLPEEARGNAWQEGAYPDGAVLLERDDVLKQLRSGRVAYPLAVLRPFLPDGWASKEADVTVELDLPQVVAAVPPDLLTGSAQKSNHIEEVTTMRELFTPKRSLAEAQQEMAETAPADETEGSADELIAATEQQADETPQPVADTEPGSGPEARGEDGVVQLEETAPEEIESAAETPVVDEEAGRTAQVPPVLESDEAVATETVPAASVPTEARRKYSPLDWDGIEGSQLTATGGVDINTAGLDELEVLPGVGPVRAREIVEYRRQHGRFENIYDLGAVPGIGPRYFRQMTGLSLTTGRNRHEVLNKLLDFDEGANPSLQQILATLSEAIDGVGCVLAGEDGVPLAFTKSLAEKADQYAAVGSQLFRRTGRYLETIAGDGVDCLALPASNPPLLLFSVNGIYLSVVQDDKHAGQRQFKKAYAVAREIGWLLGKRAIVRGG